MCFFLVLSVAKNLLKKRKTKGSRVCTVDLLNKTKQLRSILFTYMTLQRFSCKFLYSFNHNQGTRKILGVFSFFCVWSFRNDKKPKNQTN